MDYCVFCRGDPIELTPNSGANAKFEHCHWCRVLFFFYVFLVCFINSNNSRLQYSKDHKVGQIQFVKLNKQLKKSKIQMPKIQMKNWSIQAFRLQTMSTPSWINLNPSNFCTISLGSVSHMILVPISVCKIQQNTKGGCFNLILTDIICSKLLGSIRFHGRQLNEPHSLRMLQNPNGHRELH